MQTIFIHGLGQDSTSWNQTISYLEKQDHLYALDLPQLCVEGEVTYAQLYESFAKYCNQTTEPLNLCGLSLGAILALNYAIEHPSKVNSLILIAGQVNMPKGLLKIQNILFQFMPKSMFQSMGFGKQDFIRLTQSMMDIDFTNDLKNLKCPVLVACGQSDKHNMKATQLMVEHIQNTQLALIDGAGHEVNVDAPEALAKVINDFYRHLTI